MNVSLDFDGGWKEAVTLVSDLDRWRDHATHVCGWTMAHHTPIDRSVLEAWSLGPGVTGEEALFHCGDEAQGFLRFVSLSGVARRQRVRAGAASWETGGIFSLMVRTKNLEVLFERALDRGWTAVADPVSFEYGGRLLTNVILRGPEGICFGSYERVEPQLEGWDHITSMSQPFNCMQIVRNRDAAHDFHRDALGFVPYVHTSTKNAKEKDSQFGHPRNLTKKVETHVAIMHPRGIPGATERENGRVELIQWDGICGRDLSERAAPPNIGHIALRWAVSDVRACAERITEAGYDLYCNIQTAIIKPYGSVKLCSVKTPDGVLYELFQPAV